MQGKKKVYELAKELGIDSKSLMQKLANMKLAVKSHMSSLEPDVVKKVSESLKQQDKPKAIKTKKVKTKQPKKVETKKTKKTKKIKKIKKIKKTKAKTTSKDVVVKPKTSFEKKKVFELAREIGLDTITLMGKLKAWKLAPKSHMSVLDSETLGKVYELLEDEKDKKVEVKRVVKKVVKKISKKVIRRTASSVPSVKQAEERARKQKEIEEAQKEAEAEPDTKTEDRSKTRTTRKNIVGKIDLSRVAKPAKKDSEKVRAGKPYSKANVPVHPSPSSDKRDTKKRTSSLDKNVETTVSQKREEEVPQFVGSEFRKREVLFQPKKRKMVLNRESKKTLITTPSAKKRVVKIYGSITVAELAKNMSVKVPELISVLAKNGVEANINYELDYDTASLIAPEFKHEVVNVKRSLEDITDIAAFGDLDAKKVKRSPIVTVMGHVDHGKTTLLDTIRKTNVASKEAGGITQHIGAYSVDLGDNKQITFVDTPGHEAFTAMRVRGANVTDIVIIVVAVDDGFMPQTVEAINHAKAANVPIIIAINKMDKPGVDVEKIKQKATEFELVPEEWGGTTMFSPISAKTGDGVSDLLEHIVLVAEMAELRCNPKRSGVGVVLEAQVKSGRGNVATLLVQDGTISVGQYICAGTIKGKVRAIISDKGKNIKSAGPGKPVEILGLDQTPSAGDKFYICKSEKGASLIVDKMKEGVSKDAVPDSKMSLDDLFSKITSSDMITLPIVVKTDVAGTGEAIKQVLNKISNPEVQVKVVHSAVGGISESDVLLASSVKGIVVGFNVRPDSAALNISSAKGIEIKTYNVVYELLDDIEKAIQGLLKPEIKENIVGHLEVRNVFSVPKTGTIAGCFVLDGKVNRTSKLRLIRQGSSIYEGNVGSLKRFKDDVKEVLTGFECGVKIEGYNDIKVEDTIEAYEMIETQPTGGGI